jgi:signal transduction histidine kinase
MLAMVPLRLTILRAGDRPSRPTLTFAAFGLAGLVRALAIGQLAFAADLLPSAEVGQRVVGGTLAGLVYLSILALIVEAVRAHSDSISRLRLERSQLLAARGSSGEQLQWVNAEIKQRVRDEIVGRLSAIAASVAANANSGEGQRDAVVDVIDSKLKPIAEDIALRPSGWQVQFSEVTAADRRPSDSLLADAVRIRPVSPLPASVALTLVTGVSSVRLVGAVLAFGAAAALCPLLLGLLALCREVVTSLARRIGASVMAVVLTVAFELVGLIAVAAVIGFWRLFGDQSLGRTEGVLIATAPLLVVFICWGIAVAVAWNRRAAEIDSELEATVELLKLEVSLIGREVDAERERLARFVHGPVQDRLLAAWSLLSASDGGVPAAGQLTQATELISEAVKMIDAGSDFGEAEQQQFTITSLIDEFALVWGGVVDVFGVVSDSAEVLLRQDASAAAAVGEVIREGVANAVRHQRSKRVQVSVGTAGDGLVEVSVDADSNSDALVEVAAPPATEPATARRGLGSQNLDRLTVDWQLDLSASGSRLAATVATRA